MVKRNVVSKWLAVSLAVMLILTMSPFTFAAENSTKIESNVQTIQLAKQKINPSLVKEFEKEKYVTYLIKMKEQVDVEKVALEYSQSAKAKSETAAMKQLSVRSAIVSSLRDTADITQAEVVHYLEKMKDSGAVTDYKSFFIVNAMSITSTREVMEQIASFNEVAQILPNRTHTLDVVEQPSSVEVDSATSVMEAIPEGVDPAPTAIEWNLNSVKAPYAWSKEITGTGLVVANMDTGVRGTHQALTNTWRGNNSSNPELSWYDPNKGTKTPTDQHGHGTQTMGIMVGLSGANQIGVAYGAKWIAVRIFDAGGGTTDEIILDGGQWILAPTDKDGNLHPEMAPNVVNNSWGGDPEMDDWFREIVRAWRAAGIFPAFAAGNTTETNFGGPGSIANPANYPESFAVAATDASDSLASFSLRGPSQYPGTDMKPDISAPGVNIRSSSILLTSNSYYAAGNGTSFAVPHIAGTVALLLQANSTLSVKQLEDLMRSTATPKTNQEYPNTPNYGFGYGLLNIEAALNKVLGGKQIGTLKGRITSSNGDVPAYATITVLETGRSIRSDSNNGKYVMVENPGTYTLKVEGYGFYPIEQTVIITANTETELNFQLQALPTGTVSGIVTDADTGAAIAGAKVSILNNANVTPVITNANGEYSITTFEGDYTLNVAKPPSYNGARFGVQLSSSGATHDVQLRVFVNGSASNVLAYDTVDPNNARAWNAANNGWAVRMTANGTAQVSGAQFRFWDANFPSPGGTAFQYAVYDASGPNGAPGNRLAGPFNGTAIRNKAQWTTVTFEQNIVVDGDFYIAYIQSRAGTQAPGLATDELGAKSGRSWQLVSGIWSPAPLSEGNYNIRAVVKYDAGVPIITSPVDNSTSESADVSVRGTFGENGATINLYNGDTLAGAGTVASGAFSIDTTLNEGMNNLYVKAVVNGKTTSNSAVVKVNYGVNYGVPIITSPIDGSVVNTEDITVTGTFGKDGATINLYNGDTLAGTGTVADGAFSISTKLHEGLNNLSVSAVIDGNETDRSDVVKVTYEKVVTGSTELSLGMPTSEIKAGVPFNVSVNISKARKLYALEFGLIYDSSLENSSITPSPELAAYQAAQHPSSPLIKLSQVRDLGNGKKKATYVISLSGDIDGYSGDGNLATFTFTSSTGGTFSFELDDALLLDDQGMDEEYAELPPAEEVVVGPGSGGGTQYVITGQITAEAFKDVDYSKTWYEGPEEVHKVKVEALDANGNVAATGTVSADGSYTITVNEMGKYTIRVAVPSHFGAESTVDVSADISGVDFGPLTAGDINSDGVIDLVDLQFVAKQFGKKVGADGMWSDAKASAANITRSGEVDMGDISWILRNFGKRK